MPGIPSSIGDAELDEASSRTIQEICRPPSLLKYQAKKKIAPFIALFFVLLVIGGLFFFYHHDSQMSHFASLKGPNPDFVGRKQYLDQLERDLIAKRSLSEPTKIRVLWGKGGVGKSELAIEFANRYLSQFSLVWTFLCDSEEHINLGYRSLAEKLGIPYCQLPPEKIKENVHFYLENHRFDRQWLLIFDNVEEPLIDYPQRGGAILVTSQKKILNPEFQIEVTPFGKKESIALLEKITHEKAASEMEELITTLQGFPLLLNYAAHYIKATPGFSIRDYALAFSDHLMDKDGPLWQEIDVNKRYQKSLVVSWQFPLRSLEKENPLALEWLFVCAYLYPEHIPEEWIDTWLSERLLVPMEFAKQEILTSLSNFGVINYQEKTKTFSIHRFFLHMIRENRQAEKNRDLQQVITLLSKYAKNYRFVDPSTWEAGAWWYVHACEARKWLQNANEINFVDFYEGIANWCQFNDRYLEALDACYKILDCKGENSNIYQSIAWSLLWLGRYEEAIQMCNRALDIQVTPLALNYKGMALYQLGEYQKSFSCHSQELQLRRSDELNIDLGNTFHSMAQSLRELKRFDEALHFVEMALYQYKHTLGSKHPLYAQVLANKALLFYKKGQYSSGLKLFEEALEIYLSVKKHNCESLIVYAQNGIGYCNYELKQYRRSKRAFKKALKMGEKTFGVNTRPVQNSHNGLGWCYLKENKIDKALEHLIVQLQISSVAYQNNPRMVSVLEDFYQALQEMRVRGENIEYAAKIAWEISNQTLGQDHSLTRSFLINFH